MLDKILKEIEDINLELNKYMIDVHSFGKNAVRVQELNALRLQKMKKVTTLLKKEHESK